jgi:hypothetical protein
MGNWAVDVPYAPNDVVLYDGVDYIALDGGTGNVPDSSPLYWDVMLIGGEGGPGHDPVTLGAESDAALELDGQELTLTLPPPPPCHDEVSLGAESDGSLVLEGQVLTLTVAPPPPCHDEVSLGAESDAALELDGQELTLTLPPPIPCHDEVSLSADLDDILSISGQELGLEDQAANTVLSGPSAGGPDVPTFRALVDADIPEGIARDVDLSGYALLAGRAGGQVEYGGVAAGENLTLGSTIHVTKGLIKLGTLSAYDEVNDHLGIGTLTPIDKIQIVEAGNPKIYFDCYSDTATDSPGLLQRKAKGTIAIPTVPADGDNVGVQAFYVWDGAAWRGVARVVAFVDGTIVDGVSSPGRFEIYTCPAGSNTWLTRLKIDNLGNDRWHSAAVGTSAAKVRAFPQGTAPTDQPANVVQEWGADYVAGDIRKYLWSEAGNKIIIGNSHVLADNLVNNAKGHIINGIYNITYTGKIEPECLDSARLLEGTNANTLKVGAFDFMIEGIIYGKDATDNIAMTAQPVQAISTYCLYLVCVDSAGTVYVKKGEEKGTDIAVLPGLTYGHCPIGYFKIVTDGVTTFTSGTTDLGAAGITETFVNLKTIPYNSTVAHGKIRGLWIFDQDGAVTTIQDRGSHNHDVTLSANADTLTPQVAGLCPSLKTAQATGYWDTIDDDDFTFGNAVSDQAFTMVLLVAPGTSTGSFRFLSKLDLTTGATQREWEIYVASGVLSATCRDQSAGASRGRSYSVALEDSGLWVTYIVTYDGLGAPLTGMKIYRNGVRIDDTDITSGTYTAMENTTSLVGSYHTVAAGTKTHANCRYGAVSIIADCLNQTQINRLDALLRGYANGSLN